MNPSIQMSRGEATNRIFAYGRVPVMAEVLTANGTPVVEHTGQYETVGLAYDWVTNRVYRVTKTGCECDALPPASCVSDALTMLAEESQSLVRDVEEVSLTASEHYDPTKELI